MVDSDKESYKQNEQYPDSYSEKIFMWAAKCHYDMDDTGRFPKIRNILFLKIKIKKENKFEPGNFNISIIKDLLKLLANNHSAPRNPS